MSALACALEAEEMPSLRRLSFRAPYMADEEGVAQASTQVVKRICEAREIGYEHEVTIAFDHWLAGVFCAGLKRQC